MDCICSIKDNNITVKLNVKPKIKLAKKISVIDLYNLKQVDCNEKTEQDKLSQNKAILRIISGQDTIFDIKNILKPDMIDKITLFYKESALSPYTQVKWTESFINYLIRYNNNFIINDSKITNIITNLKALKQSIPIPIPIPKDKKMTAMRNYDRLYQDKNYRNKIYAKIKLDNYSGITDGIISNTKIRDYEPNDTYINLHTKKWIINEKKHTELALTDEFIELILINKYIYLINNKNNDKISSTVINNGIARFFKGDKELQV